jgi:anti-anti-sigma regulatory factor
MDRSPSPVVLVLREPLTAAPIDALRATLRDLVSRTGAVVACCDIRALERPGLRVAGVLARLQLEARGLGCTIRVVPASPRFVVLLELLGLDDLLPCDVRCDGCDRDGGDPFDAVPGSS